MNRKLKQLEIGQHQKIQVKFGVFNGLASFL